MASTAHTWLVTRVTLAWVPALPAAVVDRLPLGLWKPGNLYLGSRLHFCCDEVRTIEWNGRVIARGRKPFPHDECQRRGWHDHP